MLVTCLSWLLFNNQLFIKGKSSKNLIFGDFVRGVAWGGLAKSKFFIKTGPFLDISTKGEGFFWDNLQWWLGSDRISRVLISTAKRCSSSQVHRSSNPITSDWHFRILSGNGFNWSGNGLKWSVNGFRWSVNGLKWSDNVPENIQNGQEMVQSGQKKVGDGQEMI